MVPKTHLVEATDTGHRSSDLVPTDLRSRGSISANGGLGQPQLGFLTGELEWLRCLQDHSQQKPGEGLSERDEKQRGVPSLLPL